MTSDDNDRLEQNDHQVKLYKQAQKVLWDNGFSKTVPNPAWNLAQKYPQMIVDISSQFRQDSKR
jgi:hypothetical protein